MCNDLEHSGAKYYPINVSLDPHLGRITALEGGVDINKFELQRVTSYQVELSDGIGTLALSEAI